MPIYIYMDRTTQVIYAACAHTRNTFYRNTVCVWNHTSKNHAEKAKSAHIRSHTHTHTHTNTRYTKIHKGRLHAFGAIFFPFFKMTLRVCMFIHLSTVIVFIIASTLQCMHVYNAYVNACMCVLMCLRMYAYVCGDLCASVYMCEMQSGYKRMYVW